MGRDRNAASPGNRPTPQPPRLTRRSDTVHPMDGSLQIEVTTTDHPVAPERLAEILDNPGFGTHFTDHMFVAEWTPQRGWHEARVTPYASLTLDPATAVLHYAQEIFEGMKAYRRGGGGLWAFRPPAQAAGLGRRAHPPAPRPPAGGGLFPPARARGRTHRGG